MSTHTIGETAERSGFSASALRYYEGIGLVEPSTRTTAGYRLYTDREVHTLRFIRRARDLGFSMAEIAELLRLWQDRARASASVRRIASRHVEELERKIAELTTMRRTLEQLVACCHGDGRPDCPILEELEGVPRDHSGGVPRA